GPRGGSPLGGQGLRQGSVGGGALVSRLGQRGSRGQLRSSCASAPRMESGFASDRDQLAGGTTGRAADRGRRRSTRRNPGGGVLAESRFPLRDPWPKIRPGRALVRRRQVGWPIGRHG